MDTETLQAEDDQPLEQESVEDVNLDSVDPTPGADEAPAEKEKVSFDDGQQEWVNGKIGDMTRETNNERRRADALQNQLDEIERNKPQEARPSVLEIPDSYDDDIVNKKAAYEQSIRTQNEFDNRQAFAQEQQRVNLQTQQNAAVESYNKSAGTYIERAKKFGLNDEQINVMGETVRASGMSQDVQMHIVNDASGPLIADFLSKNPVELGNLLNITTPMAQAAYIEGTIKPKAHKSRKTTQAPDPADIIRGNGSPPTKLGPPGAKFT